MAFHRYDPSAAGFRRLRSPRGLVAAAWAHFKKAKTWKDDAVRSAIEAMEEAEQAATRHSASADDLVYVLENGTRLRLAIEALP